MQKEAYHADLADDDSEALRLAFLLELHPDRTPEICG
jgi:hypothetical protein